MTTLNHMHIYKFFTKKGGWSPGRVVPVLFFFKLFFMSILQLSLSLSQKCFQYVNLVKSFMQRSLLCVHSLLKKKNSCVHIYKYSRVVEIKQPVHGSQII